MAYAQVKASLETAERVEKMVDEQRRISAPARLGDVEVDTTTKIACVASSYVALLRDGGPDDPDTKFALDALMKLVDLDAHVSHAGPIPGALPLDRNDTLRVLAALTLGESLRNACRIARVAAVVMNNRAEAMEVLRTSSDETDGALRKSISRSGALARWLGAVDVLVESMIYTVKKDFAEVDPNDVEAIRYLKGRLEEAEQLAVIAKNHRAH